eukprot:TRINITY_DN8376_c0_g1_i4.p1 TRINITY_DN8376_c0_g1~~TRINITY_DN8376_c0_g1_i4.p1  ORF type:complete len:178 (+),score=22.43 TRINITY_DN8376_c0_g1_i4:138-671(+)
MCIRDRSKTGNSNDSELDETEEYYAGIDDFDFDNQTYNIFEFQYNVSICYLMMQRYQDAIKLFHVLQEMLTDVPTKEKLKQLINYVQDEIQSNGQNSSFGESQQQNKESVLIEIFPSHNRLCSIFPIVKFPLKKYKLEGRLSFCLPKVNPPSMIPCFEDDLLKQMDVNCVENRPEAP